MTAFTPPLQRPFHTVLVANRGEIALRILRTARRLGYATVAVYSEADALSPHVLAADQAIAIGPAPARDSYLNIAALLQAARLSGADAVHPGYGFLAENAAFAEAVAQAGLVFVGPSAQAIQAMGNKAQAKRLAEAAQLPCIPGYQGEDQSDAALQQAAAQLGYPLMVKASAGGGGRGMRLVHSADALPAALAAARSEALSAFGSAELILERALRQPRHIEIQLLADAHGQVLHLGERDCSVQRRHQKLIEESPSPVVDAALRERMGQAAVRGAQAIGYLGAGTMEFLLDADGQFYFMEMNTRLQVEHAVTEAVTGLDLVEWQLRIAAGEPLDFNQQALRWQGHAIEVRLTAEDVPAGFLPQTGPVLHWRDPAADWPVRVDHALAEGALVSPHYDSMVAKLIAHGRTREEARRKLLNAVRHCVLLGVPSNQGFLADCLADPVFAAGTGVHTGFVAERFGLPPRAPALPGSTLALAAFAALMHPAGRHAPGLNLHPPALAGAGAAHAITLQQGGRRWRLRLQPQGKDWLMHGDPLDPPTGPDDAAPLGPWRLRDAAWTDTTRSGLQLELDGRLERAWLAPQDSTWHVFHQGRTWALEQLSERRERVAPAPSGRVHAPLGARVLTVAVQAGDRVHAGQTLVVLEAMKMEHVLLAPCDGVVAELAVQAQTQTRKGALLLRIEEAAA